MARRERNGRPIPLRSGNFSVLEGRRPVGGRDYPRDEGQFEGAFATERACLAFVERVRYPGGFSCPACGSKRDPWRSGTGLIACRGCRHPLKLTSDTLFEGSPAPLTRWFRFLWDLANAESATGVGAVCRGLEIDDTEQATAHLHALRLAMATASREKLSGTVSLAINRIEIEGDHGGPLRATVALAMRVSSRRKVRIRLRHLRVATPKDVLRFAHDCFEPGSTVRTVPWRGFEGLASAGFDHRVQPATPTTTRRKAVPDAQQLWSVLQLWLWSSADVASATLQDCLHEFAFRYGRSDYPPGMLFYRLCSLALRPATEQASQASARATG